MQIDLDPTRIGLRFPVEVGLCGDTRAVLTDVLPMLRRKPDRSFLERAQEATAQWWELLREQAQPNTEPVRPQTLTWQLSELLPDRAIVTGDAGTVTMWSARLRLRRGMNYSFSGTHCTMGSAVPYAIGAKIAYPDRPVVAFVGDGALAMGLGELATLAQYELPVTVVVLHNNTLALEAWEQNALLGNPQYGNELSSIDFAQVAEGCGLRGYRIEKANQVGDVLRDALAHDGPAVVDCIVNAHEAPFAETIKPAQADNIATAYGRGEPDAEPMARSLLRASRLGASPGVRHAEDDLRRHAP